MSDQWVDHPEALAEQDRVQHEQALIEEGERVEATSRLLDLPTLSPSALGAYEICGRRGQFYHDRVLPRTQNPTLAIGSAYHTLLENKYRGHGWVDSLDAGRDALRQSYMDENFQPEDDVPIVEALNRLGVMYYSYQNQAGALWLNVKEVEHEVRADFGASSHVLLGFIDLTVHQSTKLADTILVDHKTAKRKWSGAKKNGDPRKLLQAPLYAEAYERQHPGETVQVFAYDVMTHKGEFMRVFVDVSRDARAPFIKRWLDTAEQIAMHNDTGSDMPCNPSTFMCSAKWCNYWDLCEMGAPLDDALNPTSHVPATTLTMAQHSTAATQGWLNVEQRAIRDVAGVPGTVTYDPPGPTKETQ